LIIRSFRDIDVKVGLLVYARPEIYLGTYFSHVKIPENFRVFEVSIDTRVADPRNLKPIDVVCRDGEVIEFVLCKVGVSTIDAIRLASKKVGLKLTYAGLKDSEAYSCQFVRAICHDEVLIHAIYNVVHDKVVLYTIGKATGLLSRGHLLGNHFEVALNFLGDNNVSNEALQALNLVISKLQKLALPNFFGYQRFGTRRPITHLVGKAIAECKFEDAARYIAGYPVETESVNVKEAREAFEKGELEEALRLFPKKFWIERQIIRKLLRGLNVKDAILSLNSRILRIYAEAYQAYLFNIALSIGLEECESLNELISRCRVLPMPNPFSSKSIGNEYCNELVRRVIALDYRSCCESSKEVRRLFSTGVRRTSFNVLKPGYIVGDSKIWLKFELPPASYATVLLREMLRDNLILP